MDLIIKQTVKENFKIIFGAVITGTSGIISMIDELNSIIVFITACIGLVVGIMTIIKIYLDIREKLRNS